MKRIKSYLYFDFYRDLFKFWRFNYKYFSNFMLSSNFEIYKYFELSLKLSIIVYAYFAYKVIYCILFCKILDFLFLGSPLQGENPISFTFSQTDTHTHTCSGPISFYRFYNYLYMGHVQIFENIVSFWRWFRKTNPKNVWRPISLDI